MAYSNPLTLLPAVERARKAREGNVDPVTRAADERAAKTRYALQLYNFLVEAKAPIVKILQEVSDPEEACVRIFGTRRSKTLRNRYHSWVKFARWLETSKGKAAHGFPTTTRCLAQFVRNSSPLEYLRQCLHGIT